MSSAVQGPTSGAPAPGAKSFSAVLMVRQGTTASAGATAARSRDSLVAMMRASSFVGFAFVALVIASLPGACGGSATGGTGGSSSRGTGSGGGATSGTGTGGSIGIGTGGAGGGGMLGCSADLHSVVDAQGTVVMTCPDDQGCAAGACVPACQAAAASKGNVGCDFLVPTPPSYPPDLPPCFAVFVANTWPEPANLTVSFGAMSYDVTQFGRIPVNGQPESMWPPVPASGLPQDQVAVLFLAHDPASVFSETGEPMTCPVPPAISQSGSTSIQGPSQASPAASGTGSAFHITSSAPVSAYDILPYGGAHTHFPGATMLMPTSAWGTNYVMIATPVGTASPPGPLWGAIVGMTDGTTVQILPSVDLPAVPAMPAAFPAAPMGATATYTLSAGEYIEWQLPAASNDMSGSIVSSNNPVAVFAGNRFFRLQPMSEPGGEEAHGQIPPVSALGIEYVAAPYATRRADLMPEAIPYRFVGAVNGTVLTFDPVLMGAPASLARGQVVDFTVTGPFLVSSQDAQHPFALAQVMPTANLPGGEASRPGATAPMYPLNLGDEEFTVILPPEQFLSQYVFFTDPTYPTTNLVLTRVAGPSGFEDVTVGCLGTVGGWQPVGSSGKYEVTNVDLLRAAIASGTCTNGQQTASSAAPFGVVVWGEDSYSSYAYPAGGTAVQLTTVTVPPTPQ
jgi:hypothetical protein